MLSRPRRGFTLIELLVVIAIIAILAAMLFPVFARARESARKIQCLSNIKNIAMGFQMYFTDYDRYPPREHNPQVLQFLTDQGCDMTPGCCTYATGSNPYLRWPVIIDEYVKNRDVWKCPSARGVATAGRVWGQANWFQELQDNWPTCICAEAWPPGWTGTVTDTQALVDGCPPDAATLDQGATELGYSDTHIVYGEVEKKLSQVEDPSNTLIVAERGNHAYFDRIEQVAYPEACRICWGSIVEGPCHGADWVNCSETQSCGVPSDQITNFWHDPSWRSKFARHLGGNNLGFVDGHAAWWSADAILAAANAVPSKLPPMGGQHVPDDVPGEHW
jgi:prepilin-type N-terminal cleavage/methylation domain-containing protein/prepilin-type processing-associated H-X9-DG protein